jgi:hypothetical protein
MSMKGIYRPTSLDLALAMCLRYQEQRHLRPVAGAAGAYALRLVSGW